MRDTITGGFITISTYSSANIAQDDYGYQMSVPVYENVNGMQYIGLKVGEVNSGGGTLTIKLGDDDADHDSGTNAAHLAAKHSTLFKADGTAGNSSVLSWENNNRFIFDAVYVDPSDSTDKTITNIVQYNNVSGTDIHGNPYTFTINNAGDLADYNTWLKGKIALGQIDYSLYESLFNAAFTLSSETAKYQQDTDNTVIPTDEIFTGTGTNIVMHATGEKGQANVTDNSVLETAGAIAISLDNGAFGTIDSGSMVGSLTGNAIDLNDSSGKGSHLTNDGVINAGFFVSPDGGSSFVIDDSYNSGFCGSHSDGSKGCSATGVNVSGNAYFENSASGIINVASSSSGTLGSISSGIYLNNDDVAAVDHGTPGTVSGITDATYFSAINKGTINVGVTPSNSNGGTVGVHINSRQSSFANEGQIFIGRGPQFDPGDAPADVSINQGTIAAGIYLSDGGTAVNTGNITIGKEAQNAAGIYSDSGNSVINNAAGFKIVILGDAGNVDVPNMNYGIFIKDTGASSSITNNGLIDLQGVNAAGIKVLATDGSVGATTVATTSTSEIIVNGGEDIASGTRNYGVWVEGQGTAKAAANLDGKIHLKGEGAIGVHARGNADINVKVSSIPTFESSDPGTIGSQIGFFAYGPNAKIKIEDATAQIFDVSTYNSVMFRVEDGADYDDTAATNLLHIETSGKKSIGIVAVGIGSDATIGKTKINVLGEGSAAMNILGGAQGLIHNQADITLMGNGTIAGLVDSKKYNLANEAVESSDAPTKLTNQVIIKDVGGISDVIGFVLRNDGEFLNDAGGEINLVNSTDATGVYFYQGGVGTNDNKILINEGTGAFFDAKGSFTNNDSIKINTSGQGLAFYKGGTAANSASGTIEIVTDGSGAVFEQGGTLNNEGTIQITATGQGLDFYNGGVANNLAGGFIDIADGVGARFNGGGTFNNEDRVSVATGKGLEFNQGGYAKNTGTIEVTTQGIGADLLNGGALDNAGGLIEVEDGTGIRMSGAAANVIAIGEVEVFHGNAGIEVTDGAFLASDSPTDLITVHDGAHGILLSTTSTAALGLNIGQTKIEMHDGGNGIENAADTKNITLNGSTINIDYGSAIRTGVTINPDSTGTLNVNGVGGRGFDFSATGGGTTLNDLLLNDGLAINVNSINGTGIFLNTGGNVSVGSTVKVSNTAGGNAAALKVIKSNYTLNTGSLSSAINYAVVDLSPSGGTTFENKGDITASSKTENAIYGSSSSDNIYLTGGNVVGEIFGNDGSDHIVFSGGTLTGGITLGDSLTNTSRVDVIGVSLATTDHILSGLFSTDTLNLAGITHYGATMNFDGEYAGVNLGDKWSHINLLNGTHFALTKDLTLQGSTLFVGPASTLYAGGGVDPIISTSGALEVNNTGTISLRNISATNPSAPSTPLLAADATTVKYDTATIDGDYHGYRGRLSIDTFLNAGGGWSAISTAIFCWLRATPPG